MEYETDRDGLWIFGLSFCIASASIAGLLYRILTAMP